MKVIEIFKDISSTEDEINEKYPVKENLIAYKIHEWLYKNKIILMVTLTLLIIYLLNYEEQPIEINQSGGGLSAPVSGVFGIVTGALGKFFKVIMLILTIVLTPAIPIVLYCLVAYFIIKKFLFMVTTIR
jgi:hypothetical protein